MFCPVYIDIYVHNYPVVQALLISEELANVPFLVLGNKIDLGSAPSEEDLRYQLGLYETYGKEVRKSWYYDDSWVIKPLVFKYIRVHMHLCM